MKSCSSIRKKNQILRRQNGMNPRAVSEVIGTILMLAVTVILVAAVGLWATTLGEGEDEVQADMFSDIEYDGHSDIYHITHQGGEALLEYDITINIKYAPESNPDAFLDILDSPYVLSESEDEIAPGVGTNAYWETGETFSVKSTNEAFSQNGTIMFQIIYDNGKTTGIILEAIFDKGTSSEALPDLSIEAVRVLDPEDNGHLIDESPVIIVEIYNIGDADVTDMANVTIMVFDDERYMGSANFTPSVSQLSADPDKSGAPYIAKLDTSNPSSYTVSSEWRTALWSYTGRHTVYAKVLPLDREKKYSNNYNNVIADITLTFVGDLFSGADPEVHESFVAVSNRAPRTGETVTITIFIKNKGDKNLVGTANESEQCWFAISVEPITRSGPARNIFNWQGDTRDNDSALSEAEPTCVRKNLTIPSAGQIQFTFSWVAEAEYPGEVRNIYFAVDVNHENSTEFPGTVQEGVLYAEGDNQDNNYGWIPIQIMPKVMVVDDDGVESGDSNDVTSRVLEGLVGNGISIDALVKATDEFPKYNEEGMEPFDIIVWVTGRQADPFTTTNVDELKKAMDAGKYVWVIGNKVLDNLYTTGPTVASPAILNGGGSNIHTINPATSTFDDLAYSYLGVHTFSTGANPITDQTLTILDQSTIPFPLTDWMAGKTEYDADYPGSETMEIIRSRVDPTTFGDSREISQIIQPSSTSGTFYNSIGVRVPDGFRSVYTSIDFASLRSLNEEINITHEVMTWFNWKMSIGDDLALTSLSLEPTNPKFMETVNITVIARNNGINLKINSILFYVTGEDGIERQIPVYGTDSNPVEVRIEGGGQVTVSKQWLATETGLHTFRAMIDPYYILPEVSETNNDLSYSVSTTSTSIIRQSVLIVDDDGGTASTNMISNSIDALGYYNDVWDASLTTPDVDDLKKYNSVIWNTGNGAGNILDASVGGAQEAVEDYLMGQYDEAKYLDKHNETFWLLGNGYITGSGTYTSGQFFHDLFGIGDYDDNAVSSSSDLVGQTDNDISHGMDYPRTGFGSRDDRVNKATTLSIYDSLEEVYFGGTEATANCVGIAHHNELEFFNTIISTYDVNDFVIPGINPDKDTQISTPFPPHNGYGGSDKLRLGRVTNLDQRSVMMSWDLSEIPATATIDSATLKFYTTGMVGATAISRVNVYPLLDDAVTGAGTTWIEGSHVGVAATSGATWRYYDISGAGGWSGNLAGVRLPNNGPGLETTTKTFTPNLPTTSQAVTINVQNMVQNWIDGTVENDGLALTLWSELSGERATGENEIYSTEYSNSQYWPSLIISYTDGGIPGQSPVGKENAVAEMGYMGLHWLALKEYKPDFRTTNIDLTISDPNPQLGYSYIISADITNIGDGTGACTVRFLDGDTLVKSSTVYLTGGESITEEAIWVPLYAGSGDASEYRRITVQLDPLDKVEEVFDTFNNQPATISPVYFLYDDFEYDNQVEAEINWDHEATVVNINGESTLDFLDDAQTNIISEFADYSFTDTNWTQNYVESHSVNSSFSILEPMGGVNMEGADVIVGLVIDNSPSMTDRTNAAGSTWLRVAQDAAVTLVQELSDDSYVGIYDFKGANENRVLGITSLAGTGRAVVIDAINNGVSSQGNTNTVIWDTIGMAYMDVNTAHATYPELTPVVVALGDGADYQAADSSAYKKQSLECGSDEWAPWGNMNPTLGYPAVNYASHWGKYYFYKDSLPGVWRTPGTYGGAYKSLRKGLLTADMKIYTIGLGLEHHDPPDNNGTGAMPIEGTQNWLSHVIGTESGTEEYNLWRIANTSGAEYFYAPSSEELGEIFKSIGKILQGAGTTRGGARAFDDKARGSRVLFSIFDETFSGTADGTWLGDDDDETAPSDEWWYVDDGETENIRVGTYQSQSCLHFSDCDDGWGGQYAEARLGGGNNWFDMTSYDSGTLTWDNHGTNNFDSGEGWRLEVTRNGGTDWTSVYSQIDDQVDHNWRSYSYTLTATDLAADEWSFRFNARSTEDNEITLFDNVELIVNLPDDIYEENDALGAAYDLGDLTGVGAGTSYACAMVDANDYYATTNLGLGDTLVVNIDFDHAFGNIDMELIAPDTSTVVSTSTTATDNEGISYPVGIAGTYYIRVYRTAVTYSSYDMTVLIALNEGGGSLRYPRNPYPSSGSTYVWMHPILKWTGGDPGVVDHYGLWLGMQAGLEQRVKDPDTGLPLKIYSDYYDPGVLNPETTYFWYVIAYDADNETIANSRDSHDYVLDPGPPVQTSGVWSFTIESAYGISFGSPADYELSGMDTKAFRLTDAVDARLAFYHKFNIAPTINGAFLQLGVKYKGGTTPADIENPDNYRYYYIIPEEAYNSNMYLGNDSYDRPFLAYEGSDFHTEAPVNARTDYNGDGDTTDPGEDKVMWCWNGKSSGGLFDWQHCSLDIMDQIQQIESYSTTDIDVDNDYFKVRFSFFYFGAGNSGGWWVDDVKVMMSNGGTPAVTSQDVWQFVKDGTKANSGTGCWWNGNPGSPTMMQAGIDNSLTTSAIDLTRAVDVTFNAYFAYNINGAPGLPPDCLRVEISSDGGNTWKAINYGVRAFSGTSGVTADPSGSYSSALTEARVNTDLSAWAGKVVYLRFRVVTTSNATYVHNANGALAWGGLYLDDVTVSGTSITGTRTGEFVFAPISNPACTEEQVGEEENTPDLEHALAAANSWLAHSSRGPIQDGFKLYIPVGVGYIGIDLIYVDEEQVEEYDVRPIDDKEIKDYLAVRLATTKEAGVTTTDHPVYEVRSGIRRDIE